MIDVMGTLETVEPGKQQVIEVDHSAGHTKYLENGLHTANMNVKYGGKQEILRDTIMTEEYLDPRKAKMRFDGETWSTTFSGARTKNTLDLKLTLGEAQVMSFPPDAPPPLYDWSVPPSDVPGTRKRRGGAK